MIKGYVIVSSDYLEGIELDSKQMIKYARKILQENKKRGHDKQILAEKLNTIGNAWHYLLSKRIGRKINYVKYPAKKIR